MLNNSLINILLQAQIDPQAVSNIYKQIEDISKNAKAIKINIDIDGSALQAIENINKSIAKSSTSLVSKIDTSQLEKGLERVSYHFKQGEKEASSMTKTTIAGFEKTVELFDKINNTSIKKDVTYDYNKEQKSIEAIASAREKSIARAMKEQEKLEQVQSKAINKAIEDNYKLQQAEEQRFKKLEINIDNFKQKMLGSGAFQGEMDIFANKHKGRFDQGLFSQLKQDITGFNSEAPNAEQNLKKFQIQWNLLKQSAAESGNVMTRAIENSLKFLRYYLVGGMITNFVGELRQGVQGIRELDSSLVSLAKVADLSSQQLSAITNKAYELGNAVARTGKEVIDATTLFSRMGFSVNESLKLAEEALLMVNVGDNVGNVENAADSIIAALKGFKVSAEDSVSVAKKINDMYNQVSNNFAVSTGDLANGVKRSSAVLNQAGVSMEQTIGLLTGSFEVLQNMERGSVGLSTISQRLLGMDDDNNAIDGLSAKLEKEFNALGLTLMDANGQIKDTYSILKSLAEVYPTLSKNQRAYIGELVSGKNRAPVLQAILSNWENVEKATEAAKNSMNSAIIENERYMDSIEGKSKQLSSSTEMFFKNLIDPELIKMSIDSLNSLVQVLDNLINNSMSKFVIQVGLISTAVALSRKGVLLFGDSLLYTSVKMFALNVAEQGLIAATQALTATMMASPLFAIVAGTTAIMAIVKAVDILTISLKEQKEIVETLSADIKSLQSEYDKLKGTDNRTDEQNIYLKLLEQELNNKKELLKIETDRAIQQEFFKRTGSKKDGYENMDSGSDQIKRSIDELIKLQEKLSQATNKQDYDKINEKILNIKLSLTDSLKTIREYVNIMGEDAPKALQELASSIEPIVINQSELAIETGDAEEELYKQTETLEDLTKKFEDITSKIQTYNVFLSELNSKEGLSADSKQQIISKYQQLLPYIDDEKELRKQLISIIAEEEKVQRQAYANMIMLSEDFFNAKIKGNGILVEKLGEYYNKDLENAKDLAKAKEMVESELIKNLSGKWAKYYNILTTSNNQAMVDSLARGAMQGSKEAADVLKAVQAYKDVEKRFNDIALDAGNVSFKDINLSKVKDPKTKKDKKDQLAKDIEYNINLLRQEERALESVRKQLVANKREQDIASEGAKIKLKEKEIALIKEEQKALHNLANAARQVMLGKGVQIASDGRVIKEGVNGLKQQLEKTKLGFKFDASNFEIVNYDAIVKNLQDKVNSAKTKKEQDKIKEETDSVIKLADAYNNYLKVVQDASGQWLDKSVEIYKNNKEIEDAIKSLENDLINIKDRMVELNKQRAFEEFQNDIKKSMLYLEPFSNQLELLKTKFDLLSDSDYDGKLDVVAEQFDASQRYGRVLRREFNSLSKTTTSTSQETDELINTLTNLQQQIKQNTLNTIEYQKALDNLRIDQIVNKFSDVNKELEKELNLVGHNLKMLEGGLLSGTDIVFGVDFALPTIPEDLIDKKRRENEDLIKEQRRYEKEILELKELSLEQQEKEQREHYDKAMSELIGHYNDVLTKIKDYHGIESNTQFDHQVDINNIISDGLTTTADNYNNTWAGIVSNLRGHLAEIEGMINQTNSGINNVTTKANTVSSGGSSNRDRDRGSFDKQVERMKEHADYDRSNSSEIERISREHGVDTSVAREMDKTNKRTGTKMYAKGTDYHDGESKALVGEIGEELGILPNGRTVILGKNGAELVDLPKGTQVIPHDETRKILSYTGDIDGEYVKQYKDGTKKYPSADELIRELRANDNFLFHYPNYDGSPVVAMNGDVYIEQRDGSYSYDREVWNDTRRDEKLRLLYGDMLKAKYPDSSYLKEYEMIENFIGSKSNGYGDSSGSMSNTVRNQSLGSYYMGGSQDKNLPSDFKSYRENRSVSMEQIQADQQKIIDDIAKGLDISTFREDLLKRIDAQLQEDVRIQFRLQDDLLKQQLENSQKFMKELEEEYLDALDDGNVDKAKQLADKYNEASDVYLQTSEKIKSAIKDRYDYEFSLIDKKINKEKEIQDTYRTQLDILKELNKHSYGGFIQYNEAILQAENNKLALLQQSSKELQSQLNLLEVGSYEWNIVNDRLDNINSSIQDTTLSIIKQNKEVLRQKYERELYNVEKSLFGGQTLDEAKKELNNRIKYQNEYVGGLEKELMVSKIISDARKNNVELTKAELALLNQSGNIEKVKLERLEKQLNVRMLEQKLTNLQNQKTIQQLTKKEDGTWGFDYLADQDAIYNTEQELKNAKLDLIRWERDLDNRKKQEELDSKSQYLDELRKLTEKSLQAEYQSLSEFYMDANKITSEFYNEIGNSVHTTVDALAGDFNSFLDTLDNFKSTIESYDIPENSILGIVGDGSVVQQANDIINELLQIQDKALEGQYNSFNDFINDIQSLGDKLNDVYGAIWDSVVEKQLSSNATLKVAYEGLLSYYKDYVFNMSGDTESLTKIIVDSSMIIEDSINFMTEMVKQMTVEAEKASFSALESAETAAQAMISAIESARGASQAASDAAKSAAQAAASASNIANKMQTNQSGELNGIQSFNSGGYTGDFKNGKLAVLHEKELVLNKIDTQNLLKAVNITRDLFSNIKIPTIPKMQPAVASGSGDQVFHIEKLEFPSVRDAKQIEGAIRNLSTYANQWANQK